MHARYFLITITLLAVAQICPAGIILNPGFEVPAVTNPTNYIPGDNLGGWTVSGIKGDPVDIAVQGDTNLNANTASVALVMDSYTEAYWVSPNTEIARFNAHGGSQSLDITGYNNSNERALPGGVYQTVGLCAGCTYTLTFWVGNFYDAFHGISFREAASIQLLINDVAINVYTNTDNPTVNNTPVNNEIRYDGYAWKQFSYTFKATSDSTKIAFVNATPAGDDADIGRGRASGLDDVDLALVATPEPSTWLMLAGGLGLFGWTRRRR